VNQKGIASIIGKAKKLKRERERHFPVADFKEIKVVDGPTTMMGLLPPCRVIEIAWDIGDSVRT
jgi:hypothetical protein